MTSLRPAAAAALFFLPTEMVRSGVVINEFQAAPNEILADFDAQGVARLGYGPAWWEAEFYDGAWLTGTAPIGHSPAGPGKDLGTAMDDKTPSLYVRKTFSLPAAEAGQTGDLILRVTYDDGFAAYLNGREVARANLGPAKQITYRDQVTYRASTTDPQPTEYNLGPMNTWLITGENVLALEVHNRDLGGSCKIDASLYSSSAAVYAMLKDFSFNDSNGAARTHQRTGATVTNTPAGTPPEASWITVAPDSISDTAWPGLTITTSLPSSGGMGDTGALQVAITQTSAGSFAAAMCAPPVETSPHVSAGAMTAFDLGRLDVSFRYKTSAGASCGFRLDPAPGTSAQALTGFPNVTVSAATSEDALKEFSDNSNGSRTRTVNDSGSGTNTSSGLVRHSPMLEQGPAMKNAAFRYTEDHIAAAGYSGSSGAIKFELTDAPDPTAAETLYTDSDDFEFIRVMNTGTQSVKVNEARFVNGIGFNFATGAVPVIDPGRSALVVSSLAAFRTRYGTGYDSIIAGEFTGTNLRNGGERIRLESQAGLTIQDFSYDDESPWPASPDGGGPSLILTNPAALPDHSIASNWTASARPGGLLDATLPALTYSRWRSLFWSPAEAAGASTDVAADWDGDGLTNLTEYSLGSNPRLADGPQIRAWRDTLAGSEVAGIEYRILNNAASALTSPQYSTDMTTWNTALQFAPAVTNADGTLTRQAYAPASAGSRVFLRVRVSQD